MHKHFKVYLLLILVIAAISTAFRLSTNNLYVVTENANQLLPAYNRTILLVPLDSRPPCTQFIQQLAAIVGINVKMPPATMLDDYLQPADKLAVREWLMKESTSADTAIISADMLIHGGLLASRTTTGYDEDAKNVLALLEEIHAKNPRLKLYVFSIIPRLLIADTDENKIYQQNMIKYSVQKDLISTFENPLDIRKLEKTGSAIPPNVVDRYLNLYQKNTELNFTLINMVRQGVISGLVIGQDDGQPFGLPNMAKTKIEHYVQTSNLSDRIFVTRGTDEVALSMLGYIITSESKNSPTYYIRYSHPDAPSIIMPYMPHSVATTVKEKLEIVNGVSVSSLTQADYILYVHVGTGKLTANDYAKAAAEVKKFLDQGYPVALVDLSEHYYESETLLPWLLTQGVDITKLAAYAGWNTTSNTLGTIFAQTAILNSIPLNTQPAAQAIAVYHANMNFLLSRIFDDWYFQKNIQPNLNAHLIKQKINPYRLKYAHEAVNTSIQNELSVHANYFSRRYLRSAANTFQTAEGSITVAITDFHVSVSLPWDRTFEIKVEPMLQLGIIPNK